MLNMLKLKKFLILLFTLIIVIPLFSGCSNSKQSSKKSGSIEKVCVHNAKTAALYKKVLANASKYNFDPEGTEDSDNNPKETKYSYALVNMSNRDVPDLILRKDANYMYPLKLFTVNKDYSDVVSSDDLIHEGMYVSNGIRVFVEQYVNTNALRYTELSGGTGEAEIYKVTMNIANSNPVEKEKYWSGIITDSPKDKVKQINFVSVNNTKILDDLAKTEDNTYKKSISRKSGKFESKNKNSKKENKKSKNVKSLAKKIEDEKASGRQVVFGTVRVLSYDQVLKMQNMPDPNPGYDHSRENFMLLIFDNKSSILLNHSGDMGNTPKPKDASMFALEKDSEAERAMKKYIGKKVYVSFRVNDGFFPSDTSLPLGEPRLEELKVIE
ncbi:hypothetical protein [Gardnerella vaginalis]|nr:hypothetical protein [Gardnerella vaginalis]